MSGFKTSGCKTSGFKTSGLKTSGLQNLRFTKCQVSKRLVSKHFGFKMSIEIEGSIRLVLKFVIFIKQKVQELPSLHSYLKQGVCHFYLLLAIMVIYGKKTPLK
jgi:hypothetical protein